MLSKNWISTTARTVVHIHGFLRDLKQQATRVAEQITPERRGYFTAHEDDQVHALLVSYWQTRQALLDLIRDCRAVATQATDDYDALFLVAYTAASILVDAARFLREVTEGRHVVRRKLNQPVPDFGIPGGTYDVVQKSLVSGRNAWHLYRAIHYFDAHRQTLGTFAHQHGLSDVFQIADHLRPRLDVTLETFATATLRTRSDQWLRAAGRLVVLRTVYGIQKQISSMMSDVYVRSGHQPGLPEEVVAELRNIVQPGDVFVVRKDYALTNYFLPGYWPHAALYLGHAAQLQQLDLNHHPEFSPHWTHWHREPDQPQVLESLKDGVHIRSWQSPLASDSIVLLRPNLDQVTLAQGLVRAVRHAGKPYDFDFDFARSDRIVCTELVYRAYDGLGGLSFPLTYRFGRPNLSGADLIRMARDGQSLRLICCYAPRFHPNVVYHEGVSPIVAQALELG